MFRANHHVSAKSRHGSIAESDDAIGDGSVDTVGLLYQLAPEAVISELDTSHSRQMYQVSLQGQRFQINENSFALLDYLRQARSNREIESVLGMTDGASAHSQLVKRFLESSLEKGVLVAKGTLTDGFHSPRAPAPNPASKRSVFLFQVRLFSQELLWPLTSKLGHLFGRSALISCVVSILLLHGAAFYHGHILSAVTPSTVGALSAEGWLLFFAMNVLGLFFHELGHSSACTRYGCAHGDIGAGLYFIYPVFFADVTAAWSLPRLKRAAIDFGGIYFHLIFSSMCYLLWLGTHATVFLLTLCSILVMVLLNLNPFLRFDGYWLLADLTGIPHLDRATGELFQWFWSMLKGDQGSCSRPAFMGTSVPVRITVILYAVGSTFFLLFFVRHLTWTFLPWVLQAMPELLVMLSSMATRGDFGAEFWRTLLKTFLLAASCWGLILLVFKAVMYTLMAIRKRLSFSGGTGI